MSASTMRRIWLCSGFVVFALHTITVVTGSCHFDKFHKLKSNSTIIKRLPVSGSPRCLYTCQETGNCTATNLIFSEVEGFICELLNIQTNTQREHLQDNPGGMFAIMGSVQEGVCMGSPCDNGGNCTVVAEGYLCHCPAGFTGRNCETDVDECSSEPCENNATCADRADGFICQCPFGTTGTQCETIALTSMSGVTCEASSTLGGKFDCSNAYDTNTEPGYYTEWSAADDTAMQWIKIIFPVRVHVTNAGIWFRCFQNDQSYTLEFEINGRRPLLVTRTCTGSLKWHDWNKCTPAAEMFNLTTLNTPTDSVKITGTVNCRDGGKHGFTELQLWGSIVP